MPPPDVEPPAPAFPDAMLERQDRDAHLPRQDTPPEHKRRLAQAWHSAVHRLDSTAKRPMAVRGSTSMCKPVVYKHFITAVASPSAYFRNMGVIQIVRPMLSTDRS